MFVIGGSRGAGNSGKSSIIKITILNAFGNGWSLEVTPEFTIEKLKLMALSHFYNPVDSIKSAHLYKLVHVNQGRPLSDESSVRMEKLESRDELLLLKKRLPAPTQPTENQEDRDQLCRGPTIEMIQQATSHLIPRNFEYKPEDVPVFVDFHTELRKILVSLIDVSEKLLRYQPEIQEILNTEVDPEDEKEHSTSVNIVALQQLTDMGFPQDKAIRALRINKMSPVEAMDWLLAHNLDTNASSSSASKDKLPLPSTEEALITDDPPTSTESPAGPSQNSPKALNGKVAEILKKFRTYKRLEFAPNKKAVNHLKEMGFSHNEIIDALRINSNHQDGACEWLLGDRRPTMSDLEKGLDPDGPIYRAIMDNPIIHLGLCNTKTFIAFLHMLENPSSTARWLSDPDTTPVLSQIFRIYHAEKHSVQLSRPFTP